MSVKEVEQASLVQLVYVSAATVKFSPQELRDLLEKARANNSSMDVTGMLLFHEGTFLQVLEGSHENVDRLYKKISEDTRHGNVLLLATRETAERNFGDWSMAFVQEKKWMEELPGFVDFFQGKDFIDLHGDSKRVSQILDGFRRGRWRRQSEVTA